MLLTSSLPKLPPPDLRLKTLEEIEKEEIILRLKKFRGNKTKTAFSLGILRTRLYRKIAKYGITYQRHTI